MLFMLRKFVVFFAAFVLAAVPGAFAQRDTLFVSDIYTTHVIFLSDLSYVDISNPDVVMAAVVESGRNILAIRADGPFSGALNVSALEASQAMHSFVVKYEREPRVFVVDLRSRGVSGGSPSQGDASDGRIRQGKDAKVQSMPVSALKLDTELLSSPRELHHIFGRDYGIQFSCDVMQVIDDRLYFVLSVSNEAGTSFETDDAVFNVEGRKSVRKRLDVNDRLVPVRSVGNLNAEPGEVSRKLYVFDKFSLLSDQLLMVYLYENDGQRNLSFAIRPRDLERVK